MTKSTESAPVEVTLLPCPFCGVPLSIRCGVNPYGRCDTSGCWVHECKIIVPLHDPSQVAAWNTRAQSEAPLRAEVERLREALDPFAVIGRAIKAPPALLDELEAHRLATLTPVSEPAIPVGMVPWHGGDCAPEDWDGGPVMFRGGETSNDTGPWHWAHAHQRSDIIAYTPKVAEPATAASGGDADPSNLRKAQSASSGDADAGLREALK